MGRGILWGRVLPVLLIAAACHQQDLQRVQAAALIEGDSLDFGEVPVGEWREAHVTVRNVTAVPFTTTELLNLQKNPSFIVDAAPQRVQGGGEVTMTVKFHPLAEGELTDQIAVHTDADINSSALLAVRGVGLPAKVEMFPKQLDFETLEIDSDRTLEVTVVNPVDIPLNVSVGGKSAGQFQPEEVTIPPNATQVVRTRYKPMDPGASEAQIEVRACPNCTPATSALVGKAVPSAFEFSPSPVPFDNIPVHETTRSFTRARNITWRPVKITKITTSDEAYTLLDNIADVTVAPSQQVDIKLQFAARTGGPRVATMTVAYESNRPRTSEVGLDARGGRPQLALTPVSVDFGEIPVGSKAERVIRMTNAGTIGALFYRGVRAEQDVGQFNVSPSFRGTQIFGYDPASAWPNVNSPDVPIQPGTDFLDVKVFFEPVAAGEFKATLNFKTDDLFNPERPVLVTGKARASGPCVFSVLPAGKLDFGALAVGKGAVLGFRFQNDSRAECAVKNIHLSNNAGGVFWMPGGEITGGAVTNHGDAFSAMIAFRPNANGVFNGELSIGVNDPANPIYKLPIVGTGLDSCLVAAPNFVDFGPIRYDCSTKKRTAYISNRCATPVNVTSVAVGPGTSTQFTVTSQPMPTTLAPGQGFEVSLDYSRTVLGQHYSPLWVQAEGEPAPMMVPLLAETNHEGVQLENFTQGADGQLDVLFVVSNTTTMEGFQNRLKAALPTWLANAQARGVDLRVGVTSTGLVPRSAQCGGGANGGEAGRLFPVDGSRARVVAATSATAQPTLEANLTVGACHNLVQGLETMRAALSSPLVDTADDVRTPQPNDGNLGLLRPTARLAVVVVADEDDHSGFDPTSYIQFLRALKGPGMSHRTSLFAIVPDANGALCTTAGPPGPRFAQVALGTGGTVLSVCEASYLPSLNQIITRAAGVQRDFHLTERPSETSQFTVRVNGRVMPDGSWKYDAGSNSVVFDPASVPAPGQNIQVRYRSVCSAP